MHIINPYRCTNLYRFSSCMHHDTSRTGAVLRPTIQLNPSTRQPSCCFSSFLSFLLPFSPHPHYQAFQERNLRPPSTNSPRTRRHPDGGRERERERWWSRCSSCKPMDCGMTIREGPVMNLCSHRREPDLGVGGGHATFHSPPSPVPLLLASFLQQPDYCISDDTR